MPNPFELAHLKCFFLRICGQKNLEGVGGKSCLKIASEMPVPHSLGKYFQHHEIQKYCISTNFRIHSEHCQLHKVPNNV